MQPIYEAQSEHYAFIRGTKYTESESPSELSGQADNLIKRVFLKQEGDFLWGGEGNWEDSSDLGKLEDIAIKAGITSPPKFLHEYNDKQLDRIGCTPIEVDNVDQPELYLPFDELVELRDFEKKLEKTIPDYRQPKALK